MGDFRKLRVWKRAHDLALLTYQVTATYPRAELYSLSSQMRRAAISVPINIAEGCGRNSNRELARFIRIALGSLTELESLVYLSKDLQICEEIRSREVVTLIRQLCGMLASLDMTLRKASQ